MRGKTIVLAVTFCAISTVGFSINAKTIYEGALSQSRETDISRFIELLNAVFDQADLKRFFDGNAHATIFAPTNEAFAAFFENLSAEELARLQDFNNGRLERLLRYHVAPGTWILRRRKPIGALKMLNDEIANVYREGNVLKIEHATILRQKRYKNGVVATLDSVIHPATVSQPLGCSPFVSQHDNYLYLNSSIDNTGVDPSGDIVAHSVTSCQPWGGASFQNSNLLIKAGRHDSDGPANFFNSGLNANNVLATTSGGDAMPQELNFAIKVDSFTVTVTGISFVCNDIRFGQGSFQDLNNWWVGQPGAALQNGGDDGLNLVCTSPSGRTLTINNEILTDSDEFSLFY